MKSLSLRLTSFRFCFKCSGPSKSCVGVSNRPSTVSSSIPNSNSCLQHWCRPVVRSQLRSIVSSAILRRMWEDKPRFKSLSLPTLGLHRSPTVATSSINADRHWYCTVVQRRRLRLVGLGATKLIFINYYNVVDPPYQASLWPD